MNINNDKGNIKTAESVMIKNVDTGEILYYTSNIKIEEEKKKQ